MIFKTLRNLLIIGKTILLTVALSTAPSGAFAEQDEVHPKITDKCLGLVSPLTMSEIKAKESMLIPLSIRGDFKASVRQITMPTETELNLLEFNVGGKSLLHCFEGFQISSEYAVVEETEEYTSFMTEKFRAFTFHIHNRHGCGAPCFYSSVETVIMPAAEEQGSAWGNTAITSPLYHHPSNWFWLYLNDGEKREFLRAIDQ